MKSRRLALLFVLVMALLSLLPARADELPDTASACVSRGSKQITFQYPEGLRVVDEGSIGTIVFLTESDYVTLMIPKGNLSGTEAVHEYIGNAGGITELSESMHVFAVHGDKNHRMPFLDVVEIGVNLPDASGLILCSYCPYGHTEVYGLLLKILGSITDPAVLEAWLQDVWLPALADAS